MVGSTRLAASLDPEEYHDLIRVFAQCCRDVVGRHGGHVAEFRGDGALAFFGYPQAHGEDPERAIRAALELVESIQRQDVAQRLSVRIGVATGLMAVTPAIEKEPAIVGEAMNLAARLQEAAEPDSVVISALTRDLAGGFFDLAPLGPLALKGFPEPVPAWRVTGAKYAAIRFDALRPAELTEFVGREDELGLLAACWENACAGQGQVVVVTGEPGIGKSRLIKQATELFGDALVLKYFCAPHHTTTTLHPVVVQATRAAGIRPEHSVEERRARLRRVVALAGEGHEERQPWYAALLSLPDPALPTELTPLQRKQRMLEAIVAQGIAMTAQGPVVFIIEDTHWIDATSLELTELVASRITDHPVLMIVSSRPPVTAAFLAAPHVTRIDLDRLDRSDAARFVARVSRERELPAELVGRIIDKTDGVPLFLEELTRMMLADREGRAAAGSRAELPATLHDLLMARLDQYASAKRVAQIAAVIGREFSLDVLYEIAAISPLEVGSALELLLRAGLIYRTGATRLIFKHALVRDAAYESLLRRDRRDLHRAIAVALERRLGRTGRPDPELLAHHYGEAGLVPQALKYWAEAAQRALFRAANVEAIGHTTRALEALLALPESVERRRHELSFRLLAGGAYWAVKGFASTEVEETFTRAHQLATEVGNDAQVMYALRGMFGCHYARGDLVQARSTAELEIALAERTGDAGDLMVARMSLGSILFWQGEFAQARRELEAALALYDPQAQRQKMLSAQIDPAVNARIHLSWTLWTLGHPDRARDVVADAVAAARRMEQPFGVAMALFWQAVIGLCRGDSDEAKLVTAELRAVTSEFQIAYLGACATVLEGALAMPADPALGLRTIQRSLFEFRSQQAALGSPWLMSLVATGCFRCGMTKEAFGALAAGLAAVERKGERQWEAELHRLNAEILTSMPSPNLAEAEASVRRALDIARRQGALSLELRAAATLARILRARGFGAQARALLSELHERFTEGFTTADLIEARGLLDLLPSEIPPGEASDGHGNLRAG